MPSSASRSSPTYPSPKYGPTAEYGDCENGECRSVARTTCSTCEGHFCLRHASHESHVDAG